MKAVRLILKCAWAFATTAYTLLPRQSDLTSPGHWISFPSVGTGPVQEHGVAATDSDLYVIGGIAADTTTPVPPSRQDVSVYNFKDSIWKSAAPIPLGMTHANVAAVNGNIYVLGGLTGNDQDPVWSYTTACFIYDPSTDVWATLPPMPDAQGRGASAVGVHEWIVYLAGGMKSNYLTPGGLQDSVDIVTSYDTRTGEWRALPSLPGKRDHVGGAVVGSAFYVIGGRDHGHENTRNTTWVMDLNKIDEGWSTKSQMPTARAGMAVGVLGRHIVTFGGEGNPEDPSGVFSQVEAYDTHSDRWVHLNPMPVPRHGMAAASVHDSIVIPGGGAVEGGGRPVDVFDAFTFL